ncbi:MAG: hypothetical protein NT068_03260 [Candidatus Nomurabacteria bacterium]|nr:hypothetical protein [Candidatus Nomurabacteria bacterium]
MTQENISILKNTTSEQWHSWISDKLNGNFVYPAFDTDIADGLGYIFTQFKSAEISSEQYQKALFKKLLEILKDKKEISEKKMEYIKRLMTATGCINEVLVVDELIEIFLTKEYEDIILPPYDDFSDDLKSLVLNRLARSNINNEQILNNIDNYCLKSLVKYLYKNSQFCGEYLRFTRLKYGIDKFFDRFLLVVDDENFSKSMKSMLIDQMEECKFWNKDTFQQTFDDHLPNLKLNCYFESPKFVDELIFRMNNYNSFAK